MMRTSIKPAIAILVLCCAATAGRVVIVQPTAAAGPTYLVKQDFEGTGYDNSETWTESGTVDEDYTTSPAPLVGSQSCYVDGSAGNSYVYHNITSTTNVWVYFQFNIHTLPSGSRSIFKLSTNATDKASIAVNSTGTLRIYNGSTYGTTTDAISTDTTYHCWMYYQMGTGSDGISILGFSTDGTKPVSGNKYKEVTNGNSTSQINRVYLYGEYFSSAGVAAIFDKLRLDDVPIGSSPE